MRLIALLASVVALAACGSDDAPTAGAQLAELTVRVDQDGVKGAAPARELKLSCARPDDSAACGAAAGVTQGELAPVPAGIACTQIFGGPEVAQIKGTLRGRPVDATYSRSDGCQISRWQHVQPLLDLVR